MIRKDILRRSALLAGAISLIGCATQNKPYQQAGPAKVSPSSLYTDNTPYPKLCAVEFDEQGDLYQQAQLDRAREMVRDEKKKPLLIVFIHGWQNNASPDNGNLQSFNHFLSEISKKVDTKSTQVEGVYIGWRGLAIDRKWDKIGGQVPRYLSFYSRKNDTDLVAGIPLTRALYALAAEAHGRGGHVIFVGHSFGGRVLEKAMAQAIIGQTGGASSGSVTLPADLTLLINPASEAITARRLKLALTKWSQPAPAIISVTSVADDDTSTAWGWALSAATFTKTRSFREYNDSSNQRDYIVKTAGHSPILLDREVTALNPQPPAPDVGAIQWNFQSATVKQFRAGEKWWEINQIKSSNAPFVMNGKQANAYWVVSVPKEIIHDHNDIFNSSAIDLFSALYKICLPTIQKTPEQKAISIPTAIGAESGKTSSSTGM